MESFVLSHEMALRLVAFTAVLAAMMGWEGRRPRRLRHDGERFSRWRANLGLVAVDAALVRLIFPLAAVGAAVVAHERGWGLLNAVHLPAWLAVAISLAVLDLAIYAQHIAFHKVPLLWRLHRVHHSDVDLDATTGLRFHPVEIALSMAFKIALVLVLGAPALAVIIFEVGLNALAMFNHANVYLPERLDRVLRRLIVTPDMHRVHHSLHRDETDSNYGFNLSLWDRLFGTYRAQPRDGHQGMTLGLDIFRATPDGTLRRLLLQPFRRV
ncbi:MAG TPA: sterol desaturase family protein [Rhodospirillales bacterium]|nr:sterol desaturase family protein [Rhodospirillales bacterium]